MTVVAPVVPSRCRQLVAAGSVAVEWPFATGEELCPTLPMEPRSTAPDRRIHAEHG